MGIAGAAWATAASQAISAVLCIAYLRRKIVHLCIDRHIFGGFKNKPPLACRTRSIHLRAVSAPSAVS